MERHYEKLHTMNGKSRTRKNCAKLSRTAGPLYLTTGQGALTLVTSRQRNSQTAFSSFTEQPLRQQSILPKTRSLLMQCKQLQRRRKVSKTIYIITIINLCFFLIRFTSSSSSFTVRFSCYKNSMLPCLLISIKLILNNSSAKTH